MKGHNLTLLCLLLLSTCLIVHGAKSLKRPRSSSVSSSGSSHSSLRSLGTSSVGPRSSGVRSPSTYGARTDASRSRSPIRGGAGGVLTLDAIKKHTGRGNYYRFTNIGGKYGALRKTVSSDHIESDHFPPKQSYKSSTDPRIKGMDENQMGAVSLKKSYHRPLITTGNQNNEPMARINNHMREGNYYKAIKENLRIYQQDPRRPPVPGRPPGKTALAPRTSILEANKSGIRAALKVHQNNGLITLAEREKLVQKFGLRDRDKFAERFSGPDRKKVIERVNSDSGIGR